MLSAIGLILTFGGVIGIRWLGAVHPHRTFARSLGYTPPPTKGELIATAALFLGILFMLISFAIWAWQHMP